MRDKALEIASIPKYYGNQGGSFSIIQLLFNKKAAVI